MDVIIDSPVDLLIFTNQDNTVSVPAHVPETKNCRTKITETLAMVESLNTTLDNMSSMIADLERIQGTHNISMEYHINKIDAIVDMVKLSIEESNSTSDVMLENLK